MRLLGADLVGGPVEVGGAVVVAVAVAEPAAAVVGVVVGAAVVVVLLLLAGLLGLQCVEHKKERAFQI